MISLKVLSTAAALALVLPLAAPTASFARGGHVGGGHMGGGHMGGGAHFSGGGGGYHGGHGGFFPGAVAGAVVGGAIAAGTGYGYGYYGDPGYAYGPGYYDQGYYDDGAMAEAPAPAGGDAVAYCEQRFRTYDPQSGTYMGTDGYRHPCP